MSPSSSAKNKELKKLNMFECSFFIEYAFFTEKCGSFTVTSYVRLLLQRVHSIVQDEFFVSLGGLTSHLPLLHHLKVIPITW